MVCDGDDLITKLCMICMQFYIGDPIDSNRMAHLC